LITISEHIGDHTVSSTILKRNFLKDPGLKKTILGDGLATMAAGVLGGPTNTTYAENTSVIMLTKVASVSVIRLAALFAIIIAFIAPITNLIGAIPSPVMGGISIILFGMIALNGLMVVKNANIDLNNPRNLIILGTILVFGLGGSTLAFAINDIAFIFSGMSLAAIVGVLLNLCLPKFNG